MADTIKTKKITDLAESGTISDDDLIPVGIAGTASLRKRKWSAFAAKIKSIITGMIVQNATTAATDKMVSAAVAKDLQDQITTQNTNMIGNSQVAYVTFNSYGDYYWISSPIPCNRATELSIILSDNVKNTSTNVNSAISKGLFEVRKYKNAFYLLTNNRDTAGYIFETLHPGIVWEVYYNVT